MTVFSLPAFSSCWTLFRGVFTARLIQHALTPGRAGEQNSLGEGGLPGCADYRPGFAVASICSVSRASPWRIAVADRAESSR